jgi:hypothetical protein
MRSHPAVQITRVAVRGQANEKPTFATSSGVRRTSCAACPSGSLAESGLTPDAIRVNRAVCRRYPQFITIRGLPASRDDREQGRALDCMISDTTVGWNIANWIRANQETGRWRGHFIGSTSGQHIWTVQRARRAGVQMSGRVHRQPNRMDQVDVAVCGNNAAR